MAEMVLRSALIPTSIFLALILGACSKRYVDFTVTNNSGAELRTIELDYPGGSFGTTRLVPGQTFHYHFKSLHDGVLKLSFVDSQKKMQASEGPAWRENQGGTVQTLIDSSSRVIWNTRNE